MRKNHLDTRTFSGRGIDRQGAADNLGALFHAHQTISAEGILPAERFLNIKAATVVGHFEHNPISVAFEGDGNIRGLTMFGGIVQGFLQHAVDDDFERFGDFFFPDLNLRFQLNIAELFRELSHIPRNGGQKAQIIQDGGP